MRTQFVRLDDAQQRLLFQLPYVVLGIAFLLSVYYKRARLCTLSLVFIIIYYFIRHELQVSLSEPYALIVYSAISLALPLSVLLLYFLPERGLWNRYGLLVLSIIPIQVIAITIILKVYPEAKIIAVIQQYFPIHMKKSVRLHQHQA